MDVPAAAFVHLFVPTESADTSPTLLLLHGTGGDERDLLDLGRTLAPHANLLGVRGRVLEGTMPRFFRRMAEGIFDENSVRVEANALADFVHAASAQHGFDTKRVCAVGYSNGANIAAALLLLRPQTLTGAVLLRAMVPLVPEQLPKLNNVPVFMGAGERDPIATPTQTQQLMELLTQAGASVTVQFQAAGHGITPGDVHAARAWTSTVL